MPKLTEQLIPNSPFDHNEVSLQVKTPIFTSSLSPAPFKCTQWPINCKDLILASRSSLVNGFWDTSAINSILFQLGLYLLLYTVKFCILLVILYYSYYKVLSLWVILFIFDTYYYGSMWIKLRYTFKWMTEYILKFYQAAEKHVILPEMKYMSYLTIELRKEPNIQTTELL